MTERDAWILEALARMRFLTTALISRLFFGGSRSAANKRLRLLLDAGFVRVWVRSLNTDNIYALARKGRRILEESTDATSAAELGAMIRCPRELDSQIDHVLAINAVRVALATNLLDTDGEIVSWQSDWDLRVDSHQRTIPDALFSIAWPDLGERIFALEVEHHTRAPRKFLSKLLRYSAASFRRTGLFGYSEPIVLVVGVDPKWLARYREILEPVPNRSNIWFANFADLDSEGAEIWQSRFSEKRHSLRGIASLPNGKEGTASDSPCESRLCAASATHIPPVEHTHEIA